MRDKTGIVGTTNIARFRILKLLDAEESLTIDTVLDAAPRAGIPAEARLPLLALAGPRQMSELSPHGGPNRTSPKSLSPVVFAA